MIIKGGGSVFHHQICSIFIYRHVGYSQGWEGVDVGTRDGPRASIEDEDGVDVGTGDDPRALT